MFLDLKSFIVRCDYCVCAKKNAEKRSRSASEVARQIPGVPQQFGLPVRTSLCAVKLHTGLNNRKDSVCTSQKTRYILFTK
jgi:hypothetical protein